MQLKPKNASSKLVAFREQFIQRNYPRYFNNILSENVFLNYLRLREGSLDPVTTDQYFSGSQIVQKPLQSTIANQRYIYSSELLTLIWNFKHAFHDVHLQYLMDTFQSLNPGSPSKALIWLAQLLTADISRTLTESFIKPLVLLFPPLTKELFKVYFLFSSVPQVERVCIFLSYFLHFPALGFLPPLSFLYLWLYHRAFS